MRNSTSTDRHDGPRVVELGTPLEHPCPECGSTMVLRSSSRGLFYGCTSFPRCRAGHGAHPDGTPLGVPADAETRAARVRAHEVFDKLWSGPGAPFSRREAYAKVAEAMNLDSLHFGELDARRCAEAVAIISRRWGYLFR
jgi:ssDNA-binding Zn-finger/Zn-ribbon topoisomerase 1